MSILENIFLPKRKVNEFTFERYLKDLDNGVFRNKMCLGVCEANGGSYLLKQFSIEPNALYVGAMGSGKSVAACFSLITWMCANSDQTILFIVDAVKGANDYKALFNFKDHVHPILSTEQGIHRVIDLIYDEAMARKELFNSVKAESIDAYEKITEKKLARILVMMEEFHSIPYTIMNFERDYKTPQTTANKFHTIMRIGRSLGTWVMAASQKATKSDIPSEIVPNFTQKQIFRVSRAESAYILGETKAADIQSDQKGRCETDYGSVQFPYMPFETQTQLLKKHMKPMNAECAYLTTQIIKDYIGGKSTEELYKLKKLSDLVESVESKDPEIVVRILHKTMGHKIESVNSLVDPNAISHIVTWPNGVKVAVMIRVGDKIKISPKHIGKLMSGMAHYNCTRGIIYSSANDLPQNVYKAAVEAKIELVDHEDMMRLARQIEAGMNLASISPEHLADPAKESGAYQTEHEKLSPHVPAANVIPLKPILQDLLTHNGDSSKDKHIPKLKRTSVRLSFIPKKEDTLTVLVHPQRTQNGEIFRVLFFTLASDNNIKHRYFVDHKLSAVLDEETANALDVNSIKEWNSQPETLNDIQFENKIIEYFSNFKICQLPPNTVIWEENSNWLSGLLKKAPHMLETPIEFEDYIQNFFGEAQEKQKIIETFQVKPEKLDMFFPVEIDKKIWESLN